MTGPTLSPIMKQVDVNQQRGKANFEERDAAGHVKAETGNVHMADVARTTDNANTGG